jgi:hypothetical protein
VDVQAADGGGVSANRHRGRADVMADEQSFGGQFTADPRQGEGVIAPIQPRDLEEVLLAQAMEQGAQHREGQLDGPAQLPQEGCPFGVEVAEASGPRPWRQVCPILPVWPGLLGKTRAWSPVASALHFFQLGCPHFSPKTICFWTLIAARKLLIIGQDPVLRHRYRHKSSPLAVVRPYYTVPLPGVLCCSL